ncbi:ROK family transcriptional regulator [Sphingobacterium suaedae]|uniref:ROK family transcriptional regulator n=1 Tax=Sphingobacterium suaedae TaxID=1686402 RepID=A0ABW5KL11_9SPHI
MRKPADFFVELGEDRANPVSFKAVQLKQEIITRLTRDGRATIAELSQYTHTSIPKVNEIITELIQRELVVDHGKIVNGVGRKPNIFGLNPQWGYFLSVETTRAHINLAIVSFDEQIVHATKDIPFVLENSPKAFEELCNLISAYMVSHDFLQDRLLGLSVTITGRVNHLTGNSHSFFNFDNISLKEALVKRFALPAHIENDTRAMAYGEYAKGVAQQEKNVLFFNLDEGIGMGIIINGHLYSGKSGFAGEFGHIPLLDNDIICHCGKKGCLETEASGFAIVQQVRQELRQGTSSIITQIVDDIDDIRLAHVVEAALRDDMLCIERISTAGEKIGRGIAMLLNIFNPDLVVLGGKIALCKSAIMLPILSSVHKYTLNLVNTDTKFETSQLKENAGLLGGALLLRNELLQLA